MRLGVYTPGPMNIKAFQKILSILVLVSAVSARADDWSKFKKNAERAYKDGVGDAKTLAERNKKVPQEVLDWLDSTFKKINNGTNKNFKKLNSWTNKSWKKTEKWTNENWKKLEESHKKAAAAEKVKEDQRVSNGQKKLTEDEKIDAGKEAYHKIIAKIDSLNGLDVANFDADEWIKDFIQILGDYRLTLQDINYLKNSSKQESVLTYLLKAAVDREAMYEEKALVALADSNVDENKVVDDTDVIYEADLFLIAYVCGHSELATTPDKLKVSPLTWLVNQKPKPLTLIEIVVKNDPKAAAEFKNLIGAKTPGAATGVIAPDENCTKK